MKSPQLFLLASAALFTAAFPQQRGHGSEVAQTFKLAQAAPQGEVEHVRKGRDEADKGKSINKPGAKPHDKPNHVEQKPGQNHVPAAKPAAKRETPSAKPAAAAQEKPHQATPRQTTKQDGNEKLRRSESDQHKPAKPEHGNANKVKESLKPAPPTTRKVEQHKGTQPPLKPATAQKEAPSAGNHSHGHANAGAPKPKNGNPNQTKESAKPATRNVGQVEQHKGAQPPTKPSSKAAQVPAHSPPIGKQGPTASNERTITPAPPPTKPRSASAFIRRQGEKPAQGMNQVRQSRQETRMGNRVVIREGDRTIERENNRAIIRHNESDRFAIGARNVNVEHRDGRTVTIIVRSDGVRIISTTDQYGHLIRRVRRDQNGREVIIIDDTRFTPSRRDELFVDVPPPRVYDGDRYVIDADRADPDRIYKVFTAPPVERLERHYTVDQVRYSYSLREYMPRVDLDIHFDTGSWQLTPDQIDRLSEIATALNEAIEHNPREVYLIEGHTDAVGSWEDNLSLSDRRAEAVAVALTEQFRVPPENLVTQGYGEQYLKVQTQGPSRANRRVAVRRITPLIARTSSQGRR